MSLFLRLRHQHIQYTRSDLIQLITNWPVDVSITHKNWWYLASSFGSLRWLKIDVGCMECACESCQFYLYLSAYLLFWLIELTLRDWSYSAFWKETRYIDVIDYTGLTEKPRTRVNKNLPQILLAHPRRDSFQIFKRVDIRQQSDPALSIPSPLCVTYYPKNHLADSSRTLWSSDPLH